MIFFSSFFYFVGLNTENILQNDMQSIKLTKMRQVTESQFTVHSKPGASNHIIGLLQQSQV